MHPILADIATYIPPPEPDIVSHTEDWDYWVDNFGFKRRHEFIDKYSWAIPTYEGLEAIARFIGPDVCLEVCAGNGLWAYLLHDLFGTNVIATDLKQHHTYQADTWVEYTPVEQLSARAAVRRFKQATTLMMVWPPYAYDPGSSRALSIFKGNKLVFVGESSGGCTGSQTFWKLIHSGWTLTADANIPRWYGIRDYIQLYERKVV